MQARTTQIASETGEPCRISIMSPMPAAAGNPACVLVNSGRTTRFDGDEPECALFGNLRASLAERGVASFEIDLPPRPDPLESSPEADCAARKARLAHLLCHPCFASYSDNFTVAGLSLGGQVLFQLAADRTQLSPVPRRVVAISTVLDKPLTVFSATPEFHLIYGSRDHIAYVDRDRGGAGGITPVPPAEYGPTSANNLVLRQSQKVAVHILEGLGHVLSPISDQCCDPVCYLVDLIAGQDTDAGH